jgi:hypothetical protein
MDSSTLFGSIVIAALAISECLAFIPKVKSNGIFQAIVNIAKSIVKK